LRLRIRLRIRTPAERPPGTRAGRMTVRARTVPGRPLPGLPGPPQLDERTQAVLEQRRGTATVRRRGWLMRRILLAADTLGLCLAFGIMELLFGSHGSPDPIHLTDEILLFLPALPLSLFGATLFGLYAPDEARP